MKKLHNDFSVMLFLDIYLDNHSIKACNLVSSRNSMSIYQVKQDQSPEAPHSLQLMEKILDSVLRLNFRLLRRKGKYFFLYSFVPESILIVIFVLSKTFC